MIVLAISGVYFYFDYFDLRYAEESPKRESQLFDGVILDENIGALIFPYTIHSLDQKDMPYNLMGKNDEEIKQSLDQFRGFSYPYSLSKEGYPTIMRWFKTYYQPVRSSQYALYLVEAFKATGSRSHLKKAESINSHIVRIADKDFFLPYTFDYEFANNELNAPWYSCMAQGQALSLNALLYKETGREQYKKYAEKFLNTLIKSTKVSLRDKDHYFWMEEYVTMPASHVLNGFIFGIYGLYHYYTLVEDDALVLKYLQAAITTVEAFANNYRVPNDWNYYCLGDKRQSELYTRVHTRQLNTLYNITKKHTFLKLKEDFLKDKLAAEKRKRLR